MFFVNKCNIQFSNFVICLRNSWKKALCRLIATDEKVSKILQRHTLADYSKIQEICENCFFQKFWKI